MGLTGLGKRIDRLSATRLQASLLSTKYGALLYKGGTVSLECLLFYLPWPDQNESVFPLAMGNSLKQFSQLLTHRLQPVFQIQICC